MIKNSRGNREQLTGNSQSGKTGLNTSFSAGLVGNKYNIFDDKKLKRE